MPYSVNDNLDPDNYPQPTNLIRVINILATQLKLLTGKSAFTEKPDYSILTAVKGDKGDKGDTGEQGLPGTNGTNGTNGINGVNGTDGKSAYELWLQAGNTG